MFKYCTKCGAQMPLENAFCTNCGAKFSAPLTQPTANPAAAVQQTPAASPQAQPINVNTNPVYPQAAAPVNLNQPQFNQTPTIQSANPAQYVPPANQAMQARQQPQPAPNTIQTAQYEFNLGRQLMNTANPSHNYIQAINHLQKASVMGVKEANMYMAVAYLSQAVDILKSSVPGMTSVTNQPNNFAASNNLPNAAYTPNNFAQSPNLNSRANAAPAGNQPNNTANQNNSSTLKNVGKYAAAAAVGAVAGSMLHSATAHASGMDNPLPGNIDMPNVVPDAIPPFDTYTDAASDHIAAANDFAYDAQQQYITDPLNSAADNIAPAAQTLDDPSLAIDPAANLQAAPTPDAPPPTPPAEDTSATPSTADDTANDTADATDTTDTTDSADTSDSFDSSDSGDSSSFFDSLFDD